MTLCGHAIYDILKDFQPLIAAFVALCAAGIAFMGTFKAARINERLQLGLAERKEAEAEKELARRRVAFAYAVRDECSRLIGELTWMKAAIGETTKPIDGRWQSLIAAASRPEIQPRGLDDWEDLALLDPQTQHHVSMFVGDMRFVTELKKIVPDSSLGQARLDQFRSVIEEAMAEGSKATGDCRELIKHLSETYTGKPVHFTPMRVSHA